MSMEEQANHSNQRKLKRYQLTALVDIVNRESQRIVGRLVNLHTEGLMIIGEFEFVEETVYSLDLILPKTFTERPTIPIDVDCLWVRTAHDDSKTIWSGFTIVDCSDQAKADIETLIDAMGV